MKGNLNCSEGKKKAQRVHRPLLEDANYGPKKNDSRYFEQMSFGIV